MAYKRIRTRPHWPTWRHSTFVSLWEGVLLAHDIEPADYQYKDSDLNYAVSGVSPDMVRWESVQRRLQVAIRNVCPNGQLDNSPYYGQATTNVSLRRFACWAKHVVHWDNIPAELAELAEPEQQPSPVGRWPWGDYETILLGVLAEAVHQWWSTYDEADPETAPLQSEVSEWIEKRLKQLEYANPGTLAGYMATIIRHENAPAGRRKKSRDG